jgi:acetyltransferase
VAGEDESLQKPIFACLIGDQRVRPGLRLLRENHIPTYPFPEQAAAAFQAMYSYREWLERPQPKIERFNIDSSVVRRILDNARSGGRLTVGDAEAREILEAYHIRIPRSRLVTRPEEAVEAAEEIGYPVVMKIVSPDILHKTDIGGVHLNLLSATDVRDAFDLITYRTNRHMPQARIWGVLVQDMVPPGREVIIGMTRDPQFGPLMMFGLGGVYVEVLQDVSFRLAPLSRGEALEMISEIRSHYILRGVRGERPTDIAAIVDCILRMSQLVTDFPEIVEMDINPLVVYEDGQGAVALDMRLVLESAV